MYLAVDVGASKTLLVLLDEEAQIIKEQKLATADDYQQFLSELDAAVSKLTQNQIVKAAGVALPGAISATQEKVSTNLKWGETSVKSHLEHLLKVPAVIDNDANLAGLAEAVMGAAQDYSKVLYITLSTGIGTGIIVDKRVVLPASEGGQMIASYDAKSFQRFEDTVSGPDMERRFGEPGWEIDDPEVWGQYARDVAAGLYSMITLIGPDVVVLGGGVAVHFDKFKPALSQHLESFNAGLYPLPPVVQAKYVERAVVYGCYLLAKEVR